MADNRNDGYGQSRRDFLKTSGAVAATAAMGASTTVKAKAKKGGTLRYSTRADARALDPHRNYMYYVSHPLAATTMGLMDINAKMELKPGVAEAWEVSKDLKSYTFVLRKGAEYHNNRTIDAESVKWNYERIMDPKTSHAFTRSVLNDVDNIQVLDKYTVRVNLKAPNGIFLSNAMYYPVNLIAPDSVDQADVHPIGCGPFKFKSWKRYAKTEMVRFENFFETDAEGNSLPYLDAIEGYPKREDKVRLTALRAGEVDLIENMAYADTPQFKKDAPGKFNTWDIPQVGTSYIQLQSKKGIFAMSKGEEGKLARQAVAHAIDKEAIHQAVFNGLSEKLRGFYSSSSPWYMEGITNEKQYDPDKTKWIMNKLNLKGAPIQVVSRQSYQYMRQTGELVHAMLLEAGFKASNEIMDMPVLRQKYKKADYHVDSTANSYRLDPDAWYSRNVLSTASSTKERTGYKNEKVDKLIIEARATLDPAKRKEMYTEVDSLVNEDCTIIYSHCVPLTSAASLKVKDYQPAFAGPFNIQGSGVRTAWLDE